MYVIEHCVQWSLCGNRSFVPCRDVNCPLLRGNKCTIAMGSGVATSDVVLFSEGLLSILERLM